MRMSFDHFSQLLNIDSGFIALLEAAEAAEVDARWADLKPLAEAQGNVRRLEQEHARIVASHRRAVEYLARAIVECSAERWPKRLLISAQADEEIVGAARRRAEKRLAEARRVLASLAPAPVARTVQAKPEVKDVSACINRSSAGSVGESGQNEWLLDTSAIRRGTGDAIQPVQQETSRPAGLAWKRRQRERRVRIPGIRFGSSVLGRNSSQEGELMLASKVKAFKEADVRGQQKLIELWRNEEAWSYAARVARVHVSIAERRAGQTDIPEVQEMYLAEAQGQIQSALVYEANAANYHQMADHGGP